MKSLLCSTASNMKIPYIFDIQRGSLSDGPGVRTTLFFKGCSLDCFWCHNPEGKSAEPQTAFFEGRCAGCGACRRYGESLGVDIDSGEVAAVCPEGARRVYGKKYSIEELFRIIAADRVYYDLSGGGVTFSGGECMLYPEFVAKLAEMCSNDGISVAIDTAGYVPYSAFECVLPYADIFLYDVKCLDPDMHIKGTGKDNRLILDNLDRLLQTGKRIIARTPVIPNFNEGAECERIEEYLSKRGVTVEFLPYHEFGIDKKKALKY